MVVQCLDLGQVKSSAHRNALYYGMRPILRPCKNTHSFSRSLPHTHPQSQLIALSTNRSNVRFRCALEENTHCSSSLSQCPLAAQLQPLMPVCVPVRSLHFSCCQWSWRYKSATSLLALQCGCARPSDYFSQLFHRGCTRVACVSVFFPSFFPLEIVSADSTDACVAVNMSPYSCFKSLPAVGWTWLLWCQLRGR